MLLTGPPGTGKTAVVAWLVAQHPEALRYFVRSDSVSPLAYVLASKIAVSQADYEPFADRRCLFTVRGPFRPGLHRG